MRAAALVLLVALSAVSLAGAAAALRPAEGFSPGRYQCDLRVSERGVPRCVVQLNESAASKGRDVKCHAIRQAKNMGTGSYVRTGSYVVDEGRLRTVPDDLSQCDLLPTDTLLYPGRSDFPVCSEDNANLFSARDGHADIVSISEESDAGRCRITFRDPTDMAGILSYANYLDGKAREADMMHLEKHVTLRDVA